MAKNLYEYRFPEDLWEMQERELELLSYEIREFLIEKVAHSGGHLASNLGVVELTLALHKVFRSPKDKLIWDVGHQTYIHKILTGRAGGFDTLRQYGGLSGFPRRKESPHDFSDTGHSSTSVSLALGAAAARDLKKEEHDVVAVIGDGALTGGVAFEALDHAGNYGSRLIVVLNDNEMSIAENVGGMSTHLAKLRASRTYLDFKKQLKRTVKSIPRVGEGIYSGLEHFKDTVRYAVSPDGIFEELGFKYFGPVDGHNIHDLVEILSLAQMMESPVLVHVVTKKGKGYRNAENNPGRFHQIGAFDPTTGVQRESAGDLSYSQVFGNKMVQLGAADSRITAISAAMIKSTGLEKFQSRFPERTFDVGIAEQHAVSMAAGLALSGMKPVVAVYSTFLQRAYDQILEEICLQQLPVVLALDRAGAVGGDGPTHHGIFDLSYLSHMPGLTVMSPKDGPELAEMLSYALAQEKPCAIRYPRGPAIDLSERSRNYVIDGRAELLREGGDVALIALGKMVEKALAVAELLSRKNIEAAVLNARFVSPSDREGVLEAAEKSRRVVTMEDNVLRGGFGSLAAEILERRPDTELLRLGWPDVFPEHGSPGQLEEAYGLTAEAMAERVVAFLEGKA
ncbi:MAG: 1-deoxy-D-xylulose-5-phosphate synthase [Bacillota bacterium]|nr:1-deoxy-D-xylulose-5-phosphate synthase [Bacillota bacterium]